MLHAASLAPDAPTFTRVEVRPDGVAVLTLDDPERDLVTLTPALGRALERALARLDADPAVRAIVLRSAKAASFVVGADIALVRTIKFAKDGEDLARSLAERFAAIDRQKKPVVACVHGPALGGGLELALACTACVVSDAPETVLGLPEVKLGLIPAANGLLRVAERAGLRVAIDLGLTGKNVSPRRAKALGLVDDVVPTPLLVEAACTLARRLADRPKDRERLARARRKASAPGVRMLERALVERTPVGRRMLFRRVRKDALEKTRGHYPATVKIIDELERYGARGFGAAAKLEPKLFGDVVVTETSHRLVELFFAKTALKADGEAAVGTPHPVQHASIWGAGVMGAGIACVSVQCGIAVHVKDRDEAAVARGIRWVEDVLVDRARKGAITADERDAATRLLHGSSDFAAVKNADIVIEAVVEDLDQKRAVLRELEALVGPSCVIASNTSSIPIARIAEGAKHPERVVGMHYMRPVERMPLVEIVRTEAASPDAIATAVALARRQKKTVIVVRDGSGFYTTRIVVPLLHEALHLLAEGVRVDAIDDAMLEWGFPQGPLALLEDLGIDTAEHVSRTVHDTFPRIEVPDVFRLLAADHRRGRHNGRGFYLYGLGPSARRTVDTTVYDVVAAKAHGPAPSRDEIGLRCSLAMVNEAMRCMGDGVLRSADDGDVGAVLGVGFPAFRGGPFRYVDVLGTQEVLRRMRSLEQRFGARFDPAPLLVDMARTGKRFYP